MKAAIIHRFGNPEVIQIEDIPAPEIRNDQILIRNYYGSINPIDYKQRMGNHKYILGSPFPIILGYDVAGIVEGVGNEITDLHPGDRVCGVLDNKYGGAYSEMVIGRRKCFAKLPDTISFETAAALPLTGLTALQALRDKIKLQPKQKILVNGAAGGVGHIVVQLAKMMQAYVIAVTSEKHRKLIESYRPDEIIDYKTSPLLENAPKVDVFFDAVGKYSYRKCRQLLQPDGVYFTTLPRPKLIAHKALALFSHGHKVKTHLMKHNANDLSQLINWVEEGVLKPQVDSVFPLEKITDAHIYAEKGHTEGKVVIQIP